MVDMEKVIKGLECCAHEEIGDCENCPYNENTPHCDIAMMHDAIALLKAQEPRVMTLSDVCNIKKSTPVWLEDIDKKDVICALFIKDFSDTKCVGFSVPYKWYFKRITADYIDYGIRWRCWDKEPTDEQREATPWN